MWQTYLRPRSLNELLELIQQHAGKARMIAGGNDVLAELQRDESSIPTLIDLTGVSAQLRYIRYNHRSTATPTIAIGALTTYNDVLRSAVCQQYAFPLVQACREVGSPQIRTRGTIAGNLVTAAPTSDMLPTLAALGAELVLLDKQGERAIPLEDFYYGAYKTALCTGELVREIRVPAMQKSQRGCFLKLGVRRAQIVTVVNLAILLTLENGMIHEARIVPGSSSAALQRAVSAEQFLLGQKLEASVWKEAGRLASTDISFEEMSHCSAQYRRHMLSVLVAQGLHQIAEEVPEWKGDPVLLETIVPTSEELEPVTRELELTVNGQRYWLTEGQEKTLLQLLREDLGLTGTKEGCSEGRCGACTVWLNGKAVVSCLVPAWQAHRATVTTVEGLAQGKTMHPLQQAFIECGAVQCGFCTPGMLMAGGKLLEEKRNPDVEQIREALSGNVCRCTGYLKIIEAILHTARQI
ncbi:carbon-monoxide dehydrogenase medium subunit [Thermosporothrix hazakensis]|jgi:carbon-monoxide dehydrogenase medium subunit|uniref:Carbon-monoxide dehydrogenase medium subunit n=1 Tax=Thermosporothrix hazakensis TaxID=644383 RepID=A0A326UGI3_THEHA|nr:FAD binding domain-containing protein [Thermosporothrix hazakensis]PZW30510.1 carbon-monoxide dehydrogenase medium subunit [Thermosporothrix hazakensis]GCE49370.1 hypothetical protein KTH_42390 [Thermosporothrix hazakensis]